MTNLSVCTWRAQREYAQWLRDKAPEEKLEALRQYIVQSIWMDKLKNQAPQNDGAGAMDPAMAGAGAPPMPGAMPPDVGALPDPSMAQPAAALSPQAMQLRAG